MDDYCLIMNPTAQKNFLNLCRDFPHEIDQVEGMEGHACKINHPIPGPVALLTIEQMNLICEHFSISAEDFLTRELSMMEMARKLKFQDAFLPEKYQLQSGNYASAKTIRAVMSYLNKSTGNP